MARYQVPGASRGGRRRRRGVVGRAATASFAPVAARCTRRRCSRRPVDQQGRGRGRGAHPRRVGRARPRRAGERPAALVAAPRQRVHRRRSPSRCAICSATRPAPPCQASPGIRSASTCPPRSRCCPAPAQRTPRRSSRSPRRAPSRQYSGGGTTIVQVLLSRRDGPRLRRARARSRAASVRHGRQRVRPADRCRPSARAASRGTTSPERPVPGDHHVYPELQAAGLVDHCRSISPAG